MPYRKISAIILAGGVGSRMMCEKTKQQIEILGKTVLERTLIAFDSSKLVNNIIVVARAEEMEQTRKTVHSVLNKPTEVVLGGQSRAESAECGFSAIDEDVDFVAIHDCARCLITPEMIDSVVLKAIDTGAATAVCGVSDTVKRVNSEGFIVETLPRDNIFRAQTPQVFSTDVYRRALEHAKENIAEITDDNMMVEAIGGRVYCVDLGQDNIKITTKSDLLLAEAILIRRGERHV